MSKTYEPNWESIDSRPIPQWFDDAKFGIFIHWGVYSVPAWAPEGQYSEWYWSAMQDKNGPTWAFHKKTYGEEFKYQDFAPMFTAELFDPKQWADLFADAGAKYVVLTSKHHDGYCLWPSAQSWNWNSVDIQPHRDLVGELTGAVRDKGLKMGLYYSLYEWFHPDYKNNFERYVDQHMHPQFKDLVMKYQPSLIFSDGEWEKTDKEWKSEELLAWLYNNAPNKDEVVIDDRWGKDTRSKHGGYFTTEYGHVHAGQELNASRKWEECRGIGASFGYNRNEEVEDYNTPEQLVHLLVNLVSKGGNLLLDVGPTADGRIPVIMEERLRQMGRWLKVNGEAIYGTQSWRVSEEGEKVRYTSKDGAVYAHYLGDPGETVTLASPKAGDKTAVSLLGHAEPLKWSHADGKLTIQVPRIPLSNEAARYALVFKLTGVE